MSEGSREAILKTREENRRTAQRIEQGTAYHEPVEVYFTDRAKHTIEVYAISEREFAEACKKAGTTPEVFQGHPEVMKAMAVYNDAVTQHGPESEEARETAKALVDVQKENPRKPEQVIDSLQLQLALVEISTHDPDMTNKLLGNHEASKIAIKAFELMKPPKE